MYPDHIASQFSTTFASRNSIRHLTCRFAYCAVDASRVVLQLLVLLKQQLYLEVPYSSPNLSQGILWQEHLVLGELSFQLFYPVSIMSIARDNPISRGSLIVPPSTRGTPSIK